MPIFRVRNFELANGAVLADLEIAYETYGEINAKASNAIIVLHGTTSTHQAAGTVTLDRREGWWDAVIGPGKLFDTTRYCVISANMLGSSYGSTGPASINPTSQEHRRPEQLNHSFHPGVPATSASCCGALPPHRCRQRWLRRARIPVVRR